jgi:vancomycin resistance protein YoaR
MNKVYRKIAIWSLFGLTAIVSLYLITVLSFWFSNSLVSYPGSALNGQDVSGKDQKSLENAVMQQSTNYLKEDITFTGDNPKTVSLASLGLTADSEATAKNILGRGAKNPFVLGSREIFPIVYTADTEKLASIIGGISDQYATVATDPTFTLEGGDIVVGAGNSGKRVNISETVAALLQAAGSGKKTVNVATFTIEPSFTQSQAKSQILDIKRVTEKPVVLSSGQKDFNIDQKTLVSWVSLSGTQPVYARMFGDDPLFLPLNGSAASSTLFSSQKISDYLTSLSPNIDQEPVSARLAAQNGAVTVSSPSVLGTNLNVPASTVAILSGLSEGETGIKLVVDTKKAEVREDNLTELGISELISTGYSNFYGSPANRIHNVKVGAARFNGVVIKPGEEFSFNTTLGPVDASTGYLPELVILENKTTKEFGGGMCQVSSTAFRAALNAGLPILERLYHAYPVSYYKPYGVDATIYLPKPDLVFKNDTNKYILIQTRIEGYNLYFDFYGTKVARTVTFAGNEAASGAVPIVEKVSPHLYDQGVRGKGSFTAQFWRFIYDSSGKLVTKSNWISKYDSPDKYPH